MIAGAASLGRSLGTFTVVASAGRPLPVVHFHADRKALVLL